MPLAADGDETESDTALLESHLAQCGECRAAMASFTSVDAEVAVWGKALDGSHPPPTNVRALLEAAIATEATRRRRFRWLGAAAAAIAAGLALLAIVPPKTPSAPSWEQSDFVAIPYLAPLDPHEDASVVRIRIRVATLIQVGYRVTADPDVTVPADVLVGEDGRAHAVRVPPDVGLSGIGD
jgi:anti-sigma factor RsiW